MKLNTNINYSHPYMHILIVPIILLCTVLLYIWYHESIFNTKYVIAPDNYKYKVHDKESAGVLAEINRRIIMFIACTKDDKEFKSLRDRYNPDNIVENSSWNIFGDTAFTINRGSAIALCVKNRRGHVYDINELMFVTLHELTHIIIPWPTGSHPPEFWRVFKLVLDKAVKCGVYTAVDYSKHPFNYCGIYVDSNPMYELV